MTTITRERMKEIRDFDTCVTLEESAELARIALASLDAGSNSHLAHGSLSNDRLHRISDILSKAAAQSDGGNIGYAMSDAVKAIDELLAGRKAEPVGYYRKGSDGFYFASPTEQRPGTIPLYTAPPAPVDNDDLREAVGDLLAVLDEYPEQLVPINRKSFLVRTIRAAMLNKDKNNG